MQSQYPGYPYPYPTASFGADESAPPVAVEPAPLVNGWNRIQILTPQWVKESFTIAVGVFGGLSLFKMFSHRVPKGKGATP